MFPLWLRLNQCLRKYLDTGDRMPHLSNAFKYTMSQMVTLFGAFHPLYLLHYGEASAHPDGEGGIVVTNYRYGSMFQYFWFCLFISSSLYSFCWDVYMDWGLGRREYGYLGPRLMFGKQIYYYLVICADLGRTDTHYCRCVVYSITSLHLVSLTKKTLPIFYASLKVSMGHDAYSSTERCKIYITCVSLGSSDAFGAFSTYMLVIFQNGERTPTAVHRIW